MTKQEIYDAIKTLAMGQGFYGRLLRAIEEGTEEEKEERLDFLEKQGFKDTVDMVLYFEC